MQNKIFFGSLIKTTVLFRPASLRRGFTLPLVITLLLLSMSSLASDWRYSMRPGDSIWSICNEYTNKSNCWRELPIYNDIADPRSLSTGYVLKIPSLWLKQAHDAAKVIYVNGAASFSAPEQLAKVLVEGQNLSVGDRIMVNEGSVTMQFADGATIVMSPNSELVIDSVSAFRQSKAQSVEVSLPRGEVKVSVPKRTPKARFRVKTPAAVAAVRGTEFRVSSKPAGSASEVAQSRSEVLEGVVDVSASTGAAVGVEAGYGVKAAFGETVSQPIQLLEAPIFNLDCTDPGYVEWRGSPATVQYRLDLMEDNTQSDRIISTVMVSASNYTFTDLEDQCYQVKINSLDGDGFNGLESQRQLCYQFRLDAPFFDETRLSRKHFSSVWASVDHAANYRVEVSRDAEFSQLISTETVTGVESRIAVDPAVGSVYVRAKSIAANGVESEYSEAVLVERKSRFTYMIGIAAVALAFLAL